MVVHVFPVAKLGALLIKQISKPIANAVKQGAKSSPFFKRYVCLPPAQLYNWCEVKAKMWLLQLGQPVNITVLNEAASIELGANLLGESVIFMIAAGILVAEYNRSSKKEAAKEQARKKEMQDLQDALRDLFIQTEEQGAHIRELTRKMGDIETPWRPQVRKDTPPVPEPPSREPPQDSTSSRLSRNEEVLVNVGLIENCKYKPLKGVIYKALSDVENNFLFDPKRKREPGIVTAALNHLCGNVFKSSLTF